MKKDKAGFVHVLRSMLIPISSLRRSASGEQNNSSPPAQPREGLLACLSAHFLEECPVIWVHELLAPSIHVVGEVEAVHAPVNTGQESRMWRRLAPLSDETDPMACLNHEIAVIIAHGRECLHRRMHRLQGALCRGHTHIRRAQA